jgi:tetratricopeptide (TPR) repeat protein
VRYVALLTLSQLAIDRGALEQARALLTQALARPPAAPDAQAMLYFWLGYAYQDGPPASLAQSIAFYTKALDRQPALAAAHNNRGIAYLERATSGDLDLALADLGQALVLQPSDATAYNNRGGIYLRRGGPGDVERAIGDLSQAIGLDPGGAVAYYNRGLAYLRQGDRAHWPADLLRAIELDPRHAGAQNALCWGYALERQPTLALPHCEEAVTLEQGGISLDSRGLVYAELGRREAAVADFQAFLDWLRSAPAGFYERYAPSRQKWLTTLRAGGDPFDAATLAALRNE